MQQHPEAETRPTSVRFGQGGAFYDDIKREAELYFEGAGRKRRDLVGMYLKSAVILSWFVGTWVLLVFFATAAWQGVLLAISMGLSIATIGMAIQHDANHGGYSSHPRVNRLMGFTLDVMGVCSFFWRQKHNVIHHTFTNVEGVDFDLDFGKMARLTPEQERLPWHRYQQFYLWILYGFLLPKWVFRDDWVMFHTKKAGPHRLAKMSRTEIALFYGWKLFFVGWSLVIPALYHPIWQVLLFHLIAVMALGMTLSAVFQLAHCVDNAEFPVAPQRGEILNPDWAAHQVDTTVDFARDSAIITWFLGGLNFQVEHHLFPKVCHLHYPALSRIVERTAAKHGVRYRNNVTLWSALAAHYRHLEKLGRADETVHVPASGRT
jgi:linoleoyl-CoA desaturase